MEFSKKLKKLRAEKGISQQKLAEMIFVSRSAVAKWENGLGLPSEGSYQALADYFGVPKEYFKMEEPETIIIEKNRKIKRLSISMFSVAALSLAVIAVLIVSMMLRPVTHRVLTAYDSLTVSTFLEEPLEVTDREAVRGFVDLLNTMTFRRSWRLSKEAPDQLRAVIQVMSKGVSVTDVWVLSSDDGTYSIYTWDGSNELVAKDPEALEAYIDPLMELIEQNGK